LVTAWITSESFLAAIDGSVSNSANAFLAITDSMIGRTTVQGFVSFFFAIFSITIFYACSWRFFILKLIKEKTVTRGLAFLIPSRFVLSTDEIFRKFLKRI
jgi:hypothetical protein